MGRLADRIAASSGRRPAALILGIAVATGQSPLSWYPVALIALLVALLIFSRLKAAGQAAWFGWLLAVGYFAASLFWLIDPFLVEPWRHGWMAPFALALMAGGLGLFWALAFGLAHLLGSTPSKRLLALVLLFSLAEFARANVLSGFPWGLQGYIWVETPIRQLAALVGPHGLGVLTLLLAALPLIPRRRWLGGVLAASLMLAMWGGGVLRLQLVKPEPATGINLRLIQPNAPQHQKWDPAYAAGFFKRALALTAEPAKRPIDLVIWPEAAITWWLDDEPELQARIAAAAPPGARVVLGARRYQAGRFYNSAVLLDETGISAMVYDKLHLVPFGEYVPFGSLLSRIGIHGLAAEEGGGFSAGKTPLLMDFGQAGKALPLICYEAIFPAMARHDNPRPDWILQLTNDAWFGELAGPQQHFIQARMRATEQGLPLVRVANTGISALIGATGKVIDQLPLGVAGRLDVALPGRLPPTLYGRTGDLPLVVLMLAGVLLIALQRRHDKI